MFIINKTFSSLIRRNVERRAVFKNSSFYHSSKTGQFPRSSMTLDMSLNLLSLSLPIYVKFKLKDYLLGVRHSFNPSQIPFHFILRIAQGGRLACFLFANEGNDIWVPDHELNASTKP